MQSGYGGVSEMQQFLVDGCASTLFSIPPPPPPPSGNPAGPADMNPAAAPQPALKYQPLYHPRHPNHPPPPHFPHFHPIPITQQLFQQTHHQFQLFHHHPHHDHNRRIISNLEPETGPDNSSSPIRSMAGPSFLTAGMNFKLAVNESSGGGSRDGMNEEEGILQGDDGSESRFHPWQQQQQQQQREEESTIKEPFWRPLDIDYINRNNKRCKDKEPETSTNTYCKKSKERSEPGQGNSTSSSNYKLFSELEAIYKPGGGGHNQTGSGSALTGDENPFTAPIEPCLATDKRRESPHGSDTSTGEADVPPSKLPKSGGGARRKRKRRLQQMSSIAAFFEGLVKQLMEHQESLHRKFLEVMERRDQERTSREEAWRRQEAAKTTREAAARAQERALAATREAAIISFLEKITGETLNLPTKSNFQSQLFDELQKEDHNGVEHNNIDNNEESNKMNNNADRNSSQLVQLNTSRWPRAEVQALIRVRGGLESRFQEPGLKGPLWEEVSATMATIGYHRSAKRCKEKWENINKYFRKTKDSGKKRPQHSKTCPYFHQLDQLYSKSSSATAIAAASAERRDNSELLDAIVVSTGEASTYKYPEMGPLMVEFKDGRNCEGEASTVAVKGNNNANIEEEDDDDGEEEEGGEGDEQEEGEGEGESQGQWQDQQHHYQRLNSKVPFLSELAS